MSSIDRDGGLPVAAILNPAAGHGRAEERWHRVERRLARRGLQAETFVSSYRGHVIELTKGAIEAGFRTILAVGGDGTVHEVANGFRVDDWIRKDVRLGIVPAGTAMDFARNVQLRRGMEAASERIIRGSEQEVDVGLSSAEPSHVFVNFAETGIGAAVVAREAQYLRPMPGRASFFFAAIDAVRKQENVPARIQVDGVGVYEGRLVSVVVANGRYFGGGMKIAPRASMEDGLFDVLVLGDFSRGELLTQIWKIYPGVHVRHSKVAWLRGSRVEVEPLAPSQLDLDGELYGQGPYRFSVLPRALRVLV